MVLYVTMVLRVAPSWGNALCANFILHNNCTQTVLCIHFQTINFTTVLYKQEMMHAYVCKWNFKLQFWNPLLIILYRIIYISFTEKAKCFFQNILFWFCFCFPIYLLSCFPNICNVIKCLAAMNWSSFDFLCALYCGIIMYIHTWKSVVN